MAVTGHSDRTKFKHQVLNILLEEGLIEMTIPDKPGKEIAIRIVEGIAKHKIRDWRTNEDAINKMRGEIDDLLFEVAEEHGLELSLEDHDEIIDRCIEVAIANED